MTVRKDKKLALDRLYFPAKIIPNLILLIYVCIDLMKFFQVISPLIGNIITVFLGTVAIIYSCMKNGIKRQMPILIFVFIYTLFGAISILFNWNANPQELLWPFAFIGITTLLLNFIISTKLVKYIYYLVAIFLMFQIITSGSVNNLDTVSSRNTISIMVLLYFAIYAINSFKNNRKITIFPVLVGLVVVIMAIGRSGIITFLLLTVLFLFFKFNGKEHKHRNPFKSMFILIGGGIVLWLSYNFLGIYFEQMLSNFESRGLESIRKLIWVDYLNKTFNSAGSFLFGTPISGTYLLDMYSHNLHNSFLMLHAKYGIVMFISVVLLVIKAFIYYIKINNILYLSLLSVLLFRMQFDYTNFNAQLDIIFFYFILFPYIDSKIKNNKKIGV